MLLTKYMSLNLARKTTDIISLVKQNNMRVHDDALSSNRWSEQFAPVRGGGRVLHQIVGRSPACDGNMPQSDLPFCKNERSKDLRTKKRSHWIENQGKHNASNIMHQTQCIKIQCIKIQCIKTQCIKHNASNIMHQTQCIKIQCIKIQCIKIIKCQIFMKS